MAHLSEQEITLVRQAPMFASLPEQTVRELIEACAKLIYTPTETIYRPKEKAQYLFVIISGHVRQFTLEEGRNEEILAVLGPGQSFGENQALQGSAYGSYAEAVDDMALLAVDRATYQKVVKHNVQNVAGMVDGLSRKLQQLSLMAGRVSRDTIRMRLAGWLDEERKSTPPGEPILLPADDAQLGECIGAPAEGVTGALAAFREEGIITRNDRDVTILDLTALQAIASGKPMG